MVSEPALSIRLLGGFETRVGANIVPSTVWRQRRAAATLKLLALEPGHRMHREQLLDTLWPGLDPDSAANNLRVALHHARTGLAKAGAPLGLFLVRDGDMLDLGPRDRLVIDVELFTEAASRAWQSADPAEAERAADLYGGDLLPEDLYDDWVATRREALRVSYLTLLTRLGRLHEERGNLIQAIAVNERILLADPLDETAHVSLMRLHAQMGKSQLALAHYARLQDLLDRELGTRPEPATQELAAAIQAGRIAPAPTSYVAPPPSSEARIAPIARVPVPVDALVGRERELAELDRLLATARLVTLTGAGGIGKTRLAQEAARSSSAQFPDGVAFVELAPLRDFRLVLPTIARTLGVDESASGSIKELVAATIADRRMLLVLDNLEHLTDAGPDLADLLASCSRLRILVTSRVRLQLRGEHEYPVQPLALPERRSTREEAPLSELSHVAAIELFALRGHAAQPSFVLTDQNIDAVVAICARLDGLPLAIELAAAQVRLLAPAQLLRRLERPLDVLSSGARDVPARQRTLRDTIAWSHDLLTLQEQVLFRRLSVFVGGWSLEATEEVARIGGRTSPIDAVETLGRLIDHSLVEARSGTDDTELRYAMLETIREFARERLVESGEEAAIQQAFEQCLLGLVKQAKTGIQGPKQIYWLGRLDEEHANIRAALGSALERGDGEAALRLAPPLWEFWRIRGNLLEGTSWLERALQLTPSAPAALRAAAEFALGKLAIDLDDFNAAGRHFDVSADLWQELGDRCSLMEAKNGLVIVKLNTDAFIEGGRLGLEALTIARELRDARGIATSLFNMGLIARADGKIPLAVELLEDALAIWREQGDPKWIALTVLALGVIERRRGNIERARAFLAEGEGIFKRQRNLFNLAVTASEHGLLEHDAGQTARALTLHAEALQYFTDLGSPGGIIESIEWIAVCAVSAGDPLRALQLFGAAAAARNAMALPRMRADAPLVATGLENARRAAGGDAEAALAYGRTLSLDQARELALTIAQSQGVT